MTWKSLLPRYGDKSVRQKLRELDQAGIGIPMMIILLLQKSFETLLKDLGEKLPLPLWTTFLLSAAATFTIWVYDKQLQRKASEAKDKAKEKVEQ